MAVWYFDAWQKLSSVRPLGAFGGAGRIPFDVIDVYADRHGVDADQLSRMLWAMDEVYLPWLSEQQKPDKDK